VYCLSVCLSHCKCVCACVLSSVADCREHSECEAVNESAEHIHLCQAACTCTHHSHRRRPTLPRYSSPLLHLDRHCREQCMRSQITMLLYASSQANSKAYNVHAMPCRRLNIADSSLITVVSVWCIAKLLRPDSVKPFFS